MPRLSILSRNSPGQLLQVPCLGPCPTAGKGSPRSVTAVTAVLLLLVVPPQSTIDFERVADLSLTHIVLILLPYQPTHHTFYLPRPKHNRTTPCCARVWHLFQDARSPSLLPAPTSTWRAPLSGQLVAVSSDSRLQLSLFRPDFTRASFPAVIHLTRPPSLPDGSVSVAIAVIISIVSNTAT